MGWELRRGFAWELGTRTDGLMGAGGASAGLFQDELGGVFDFRRWLAAPYGCGRGADEDGGLLMGIRGLAEEPCRLCIVDVVETGDAAWDAIFSTSSSEFDCQPLLTLIMAYDRRVFNSLDNSPIWPPAADVLLTALGFLEWPFTGLWLSVRLLTSPSAIRFREFVGSVAILC